MFATTSNSLFPLATRPLQSILHTFFLSCTFKRFSFWSKQTGLEPEPTGLTLPSVLSTYTILLISATLNSAIVQIAIKDSTSFGFEPKSLRLSASLFWTNLSPLYFLEFVHVAYLIRLYTHYSITLFCAYIIPQIFPFVNTFER